MILDYTYAATDSASTTDQYYTLVDNNNVAILSNIALDRGEARVLNYAYALNGSEMKYILEEYPYEV